MFVSLQVHFHKTAIHLFSVELFAFVCFAFLKKYYLPLPTLNCQERVCFYALTKINKKIRKDSYWKRPHLRLVVTAVKAMLLTHLRFDHSF
jgi:hypothetical protein